MIPQLNNLYEPGEQGAQKHFVFANPAETQTRKDDPLANVDSVMVGCFPTFPKDKRVMRGWAVIIRKRQLTEVMRNLDAYRASGIIEWFLNHCPDPDQSSREPKAREDSPKPEADKRVAEEASVPSDSVAAEAADESRDPGEPAGTSASAAN